MSLISSYLVVIAIIGAFIAAAIAGIGRRPRIVPPHALPQQPAADGNRRSHVRRHTRRLVPDRLPRQAEGDTTTTTAGTSTIEKPGNADRSRPWHLVGRRQDPGDIQQCPSFVGKANWEVEAYTGYNYNTSYIGHGDYESIPQPAKMKQIESPTRTAIFGDGEYKAGAEQIHAGSRSTAPATTASTAAGPARRASAISARRTSPSATATPTRSPIRTPMMKRLSQHRHGTGFLADNSLYAK